MPDLNSSSVDSFFEAVKIGAEESASAFARTFDVTVTIEPKERGNFNIENFSSKLNEKGLALLLQVGAQGIAVLIPSSTGLIPSWCDAPDATGKSKLSTFAQEWAMNLAPDDFFPEDFKAAVIQNMAQGLLRAMLELDAGYIELAMNKEDGTSVSAYMVWALSAPEKLLVDPAPALEDIPQAPSMEGAPPSFGGGFGNEQADPFTGANFGPHNFVGAGMPQHHRLADLPGYARSVLKVKVPVATILAKAKKPIKTVLELGVGSIIQFDKSCDEMLDIEVGQTIVIASAEAVKVGDKFGFRVSSIKLPEERFRQVEVRREGEYRVQTDSPQIIGKAPIKSFKR